ncbi:WS/DGAT/MGAT family O-acyltransferase [Mycobacterium sherrisii]|uniref:WS/DGAT/MGAT family O-acyltransferase n=1 Tax=Mycobacterium sherrisii TaxID=243061 RepID=UPI000A15DE76|nr:wax ester/triacylglycerol synthase family O-acyltransferase [Mycobacterium sherrisii]MCV7030847.1 wax ester/triacylglycerol synthase family O-acyltransferase [Mycobacterium sherrisii]ORW74709.1 diacylglycerol O-acyltransferase [Mycobacterium sherrisii]
MDRLTTFDAGFLKAEDADPRVSMAIGGLAVIEGPALDQTELMPAFVARIGACPRFRQRLRLRPFDLGAPRWVDDLDFDIDRHVRRVALPQPGDDRQLFGLVADLMARGLDRHRPLWEIWVIEGLADDRWAMLTKIHHCMADGIAAAHMLAGLCDDGVGESFARHIRAAKEAKSAAVKANSPTTLSGWWNMPVAVAAAAGRAAQGAAQIAFGLLRPAPSPLNGPIGDLRRYSGARVRLADIEQVCRAFDVTVNDVALAAVTESYRNLLVKRGEPLLPDSLRTLVPVSMRSTRAFDKTDNRVSVLLPELPIDEENPVRRLRIVHSRLDRTKTGGQCQAGNAFVALANHVPFAFTAWALELLTRLPQRGVVTVATNVPGPRRALRVLGKDVLAVYPVPPIAMHLRTGVAMLSYADELFIGILADYDGMADVDELARGIEAAVGRLVSISKRRKAHYARGPLSLVV